MKAVIKKKKKHNDNLQAGVKTLSGETNCLVI